MIQWHIVQTLPVSFRNIGSRWKETGGQRVENVAVSHIIANLLGCVKRLHERMGLWRRLVRNCAIYGNSVV